MPLLKAWIFLFPTNLWENSWADMFFYPQRARQAEGNSEFKSAVLRLKIMVLRLSTQTRRVLRWRYLEQPPKEVTCSFASLQGQQMIRGQFNVGYFAKGKPPAGGFQKCLKFTITLLQMCLRCRAINPAHITFLRERRGCQAGRPPGIKLFSLTHLRLKFTFCDTLLMVEGLDKFILRSL